MEEKKIDKIKNNKYGDVKVLTNELKKFCFILKGLEIVKGIYFYGSCVKKGYSFGSDIDIMIIVDDSIEDYEEKIKKLELFVKFIEEEAKEKKLDLHFQPPKSFSLFWHLVKIAEPWLISSIRTCIIIYDGSDFIKLIKKLISEGKIYGINEKSERLFSRAIENFFDIREKLLKVPIKFLNVITIVSQMILNYFDIITSSSNETYKNLKQKKDFIGISDSFLLNYEELIKINEKIYKGTLSEFSGDEIDLWTKKINSMVQESKKIIIKLKKEEDKKRLEETYSYVVDLCRNALDKKIPDKKTSSSKILNEFIEKFSMTQKIPDSYKDALLNLDEYIKKRKFSKKIDYIDKNYFKGMELIIKDFKRKND